MNYNRLNKLRPVVDFLNEKFGCVPMERFLSIYEQQCATKAHSYLRAGTYDRYFIVRFIYRIKILSYDIINNMVMN